MKKVGLKGRRMGEGEGQLEGTGWSMEEGHRGRTKKAVSLLRKSL